MTAATTTRRPRTVPLAKPIGGLLDRRFVYVPAAQTDISKTFERIRAEQAMKGKK